MCQIWNWQLLDCLNSLSVPAYILKRENQFFPTTNIHEGRPLFAVSYINSDDECLVLRYKSLCGLLTLKNDDLKVRFGEHVEQNNLRPFPSFLGHITDVNISSNQQLIAVKTTKVC